MEEQLDSIDERINEINKKRKWANGKLIKSSSKVFKIIQELEKATFADGSLTKKQKELIAVGISVITNCESCMQWHISEAVNDGASEQEILEAIEVAFEMGIGPATVNGRFALEVMDSLFHKK
ncbi:MAG: carboxymuconolactone decarboxylase family protein [Ignavibacteriales bacterium]|nr:MAG: carboxymuconolactone decarboxylase family protein [Ignavibacteriales bacterium]